MANRPRITGLVWDNWNREHIRKHHVTEDEVEDAIDSDFAFKPSYKNRYLVTGRTRNGRVISVAIGVSPKAPTMYYVFSARPASRSERRALEEHEQ